MLRPHLNLNVVAKPRCASYAHVPRKAFAIGKSVYHNAPANYVKIPINCLFTLRTPSILYEEKKSGFLSGITSKIKTIISGQESAAPQETPKEKETKPITQETTTRATESAFNSFDQATQAEMSKLAKEAGVSEEELAKAEAATQQGQFDMNTFRIHLKSLTTAGGMKAALKFVPGIGKLKDAVDKATSAGGIADPVEVQKQIALIDAMTEEERKNPQLFMNHGFKAKQRLAKATGQDINNVNRLVEWVLCYANLVKLQTYEQFKFLQTKMIELGKLGKVPTTMHEMIQMMSQGGNVSKKDARGLQGKMGK